MKLFTASAGKIDWTMATLGGRNGLSQLMRATTRCPVMVTGLLVQQREASMSVLAFFVKLLDPSAIQRAESRGCAQAATTLQVCCYNFLVGNQ
jgi:hypothetical protein